MRKLVVFNDHSWQRPQYRSKRRPVSGNATLAERCLLGETSSGERQISLLQNDYQNTSALKRWLNRTFGLGVRREIFEAYEFLARNYMPGDEIYLIGSGRGAFALQYAAYMISVCGLLHVESLGQLKQAYIYSRLMGTARRGPSGQKLKDSFESREVPIRFLGCWDTVGSHGVPARGLRHFSMLWGEFLSENVSPAVQNAFQAFALDETSPAFKPHIWIGVKSEQLRCLEQVWFAGKHANITGGQRDSRLSDIAFRWMLNKATEQGLHFDTQKVDDLSTPDPMGQLQEESLLDRILSKTGSKEYLRKVGRADTHLSRSQIPGTEKLHYSVLEKQKKDADYSPLAFDLLPPSSLLIALDQDSLHKSNRRHDRHPINCPATLLVDQSRYNGNVVDFSEGGARVWLHLDKPIGTQITLRSSVLSEKDYTGHIVWKKDQSIGVAFKKSVNLEQIHFPEGYTLQ
jgi:hypothetical protein